ncbi:MAG: N-(5'-phosphoribosyl)anthranilate isomerase [Phycisphaerales bacterium]
MPPHRTRIKICGVRTPDAALAAAEAGADAIGFVFVAGSPRVVDPSVAWGVIQALPPFVTTVGLFRNASVDDYLDGEQSCPTDFGQLHGDEPEDVVRACGPRVIKAIRFDGATIEHDLARWSAIDEVDAVLVDGGDGGQGVALDWVALARAAHACTKPLILAGGLTPENVGEAVKIVRPFAVDVSSGVESSPGVKDPAKIAAFCAAVRAADHL